MRNKGFTLLELLIVVPLSFAIIGGAIMIIGQVFTNTARTNDRLIALNSVGSNASLTARST